MLFHKKIKFTLAYQATLHLQIPEGDQRSFQDANEAEKYAEHLDPLTEKSPQCQEQGKTLTQTHKINR